MKKFIYFVLAVVLAFSLAACGGKDDAPSGSDSAVEENDDINIEEDVYDDSETTGESGVVSGGDMESAVAGYLSAIGGPASITLCGGSSIEFEPASEWLDMYGDSWAISDPDMTYDELVASVDSQLTAAGFAKDGALMGWQWTIRAGVQSIGLMIGEDGTNINVYMTHFPECYSQAYIAEQEAIMPKIIPAVNAFEKLPENFSMTWKTNYNAYTTLCRKDGSWFYGYDSREAEDPSEWAFYSAAIAQPDGSFLYYQWDSDESSPGSPTDWFTSSTENPDELLSDVLDYEGMTDSGSPSLWLQMCYDYTNPDQSDLWLRYEISDNMVLSGTENIAGVECDIVVNDSMFNKTEYSYDPTTGILFRFGTLDIGGESEEIPYSYTVTEFTDAPATLGTYTE